MDSPGVANATTVGWAPNPSGRGTPGLVISCIVTFTLCVWSALHLNVPPANCTHGHLGLEKTRWVLYGIFAPELVVATAASQYITARWLKREIEKDAVFRRSSKAANEGMSTDTWSLMQCFYAAMGGFVANVPGMTDDRDEASQRVTLTPAGIRLLSFVGRLPKIDKAHIQDKSKADWMAKAIVCVQATWMVAQVLGRLINSLPVSLLEINTCGHVVCAMVLYLLWWNKPLDIQDPSILGEGDEDILTLMFLCSKVSGRNDGVPDIRCFYYNFSGSKENQLFHYRPSGSKGTGIDFRGQPQSFVVSIELSRGSSGTKDIPKFIGTTGSCIQMPDENNGFIFEYETTTDVAAECSQYLQPPYSDLTVRHGDTYCRRAKLGTRELAGYRVLPVCSLRRASRAVDKIWAERTKRKEVEYTRLYFTVVQALGDGGYYLSETEYVVGQIPNLPSLSDLSLGQIDIQQNLLPAIFAFTALTYGGLHLSAWNGYYPSQPEQYMWIAAALWIACSGGLVWASCSVGLLTRKFNRAALPRIVVRGDGKQNRWRSWLSTAKWWGVYAACLTFAATRVFLVVEAFVSLREAPKEMYLTPDWSAFLPHL